jgi:hypothetical protein
MKVLCPVCGREGTLGVRGNSQRVVHSVYVDGKRKQVERKVEMGTEKSNTAFFNEINGGRSLAWLGHRPPTPTTRVRIPATAPAIALFCVFVIASCIRLFVK